MLDIAQSTGGIARFNHNDVVGILQEDFKQSQNYYTISYSPSNTNWNGNYRRIDVALQQKGYHLVYRRGYFARDQRPEPMPTVDQFTLAMKHGAAPETAVLFSAKLHKSADTVDVEYAIDPQTLQFRPEPSGKELAEVACVIVEYDSAGRVIGTSQIQVSGKVSPEQRANLHTNAFPAKQSCSSQARSSDACARCPRPINWSLWKSRSGPRRANCEVVATRQHYCDGITRYCSIFPSGISNTVTVNCCVGNATR